MKRARLEAALRRKVRLKITTRKRGLFNVTFPVQLTFDGQRFYAAHVHKRTFLNKKAALVYLFTQLRCMPEITITVQPLELNFKP